MDINEINKMRINESAKKHLEFMKKTKSNEILVVILKGHMFIEQEITNLLKWSILDECDFKKFTFKDKLKLAKSLGLIIYYYNAINMVNIIRNNYAHDINYEFNEAEFNKLLMTLPKEGRDIFLNEYEEDKSFYYNYSMPEFNFKTQLLLGTLWISIIICQLKASELLTQRIKEKDLIFKGMYLND